MFFIIISALHVLGGFITHHQELIKLYVQPWVLSCFPAVYRWCGWVGTVQRKLNQRDATYTMFFIIISALHVSCGKTDRNMYSADNNKEHCISCISLAI